MLEGISRWSGMFLFGYWDGDKVIKVNERQLVALLSLDSVSNRRLRSSQQFIQVFVFFYSRKCGADFPDHLKILLVSPFFQSLMKKMTEFLYCLVVVVKQIEQVILLTVSNTQIDKSKRLKILALTKKISWFSQFRTEIRWVSDESQSKTAIT